MVSVLYVDDDLIVAVKPAGVEAQAARKFAPDMISELKKYLVIHRLSTPGREPYVTVIHRLDKPVSGVMVYARTKSAAAALSLQLQQGKFSKIYEAVVRGKPGKTVDNYVDYLAKAVEGNESHVVEKGITGAKRAELSWELLDTVRRPQIADGVSAPGSAAKPPAGEGACAASPESGEYSRLRIRLGTGRHHQIRVQLAAHGYPIVGDGKYGPKAMCREAMALCAVSLSFCHPRTGKKLEFSIRPAGGAFEWFHG